MPSVGKSSMLRAVKDDGTKSYVGGAAVLPCSVHVALM